MSSQHLPWSEVERIVGTKGGALTAEMRKLGASFAEFGPFKVISGDDARVTCLQIGETPVVVDGTLHVETFVEDGCEADHSLLIVLGDLIARDLLTLNDIVVAGDVTVRGTVFGDSLGDKSLVVGGLLRCGALVEHGHHFDLRGGLACTRSASVQGHLRDAEIKGRAAFADAIVDDAKDGAEADLPAVLEILRAGRSLFKSD